MIVKKRLFDDMVSKISSCIRSNKVIQVTDAVDLGVDYDSLISLYSQIFIRQLKTEIRKVSDQKMQSVVQRVMCGQSLTDISAEFRVGTFKFAKLYLEAVGKGNLQLSSLVQDPYQIEDIMLRGELLTLIASDPICAHELEQVKECLGREYEELLVSLLDERHMCFETEAELRSRGKPKTPDVLFLIPMATVHGPHIVDMASSSGAGVGELSQSDRDGQMSSIDRIASHATRGRLLSSDNMDLSHTDLQKQIGQQQRSMVIINWIDSKAMFADILTFQENLEQFRAYNNRYGRGLVIYWHGFCEEIYSLLEDDMIIVTDHFPDEWMFPTGEPADGNVPSFDHIPL